MSDQTESLESLNYPRKNAIDFATWYSGMDREKVKKAYNRFLKETKKRTIEDNDSI